MVDLGSYLCQIIEWDKKERDHITPLLAGLHRLRVDYRIQVHCLCLKP